LLKDNLKILKLELKQFQKVHSNFQIFLLEVQLEKMQKELPLKLLHQLKMLKVKEHLLLMKMR
jgi:hypothetical protein